MLIRQRKRLGAIAIAAACLVATPALAENIAVGNYGSSANGMPFAVALYKGFFKEEGADVTGIIASQGGGIRNRQRHAAELDVPRERSVVEGRPPLDPASRRHERRRNDRRLVPVPPRLARAHFQPHHQRSAGDQPRRL